MRQWVSALVVLIVVALVATLIVSSAVTVIVATEVLRQAVVDIDDLTYADSLGECDPFDSFPCY